MKQVGFGRGNTPDEIYGCELFAGSSPYAVSSKLNFSNLSVQESVKQAQEGNVASGVWQKSILVRQTSF
jgi:hypothetical protein